MMWSKQQLENLALGGQKITSEKVMKYLSLPENAQIFEKDNFSYLWGALGVAGLIGTDEVAQEKIWIALSQNGVLDAYDKGILGDFNRRLGQHFKDNRLRAWLGLDNLGAGKKFEKTILKEFVKVNPKLKLKALSYCKNKNNIIDTIIISPLNDALKEYLQSIITVSAGDSDLALEKASLLRRLAQNILCMKRVLTEEEKDYLFHYFISAIDDGFQIPDIGLADGVLAKFTADESDSYASELEAAPSLQRNQEIADFARAHDETYGLFEETAAQLVKREPSRTGIITQHCLDLIHKGHPKGVVLALALLELNQIKSSVSILLELSRYGQSIEMVGFLHRLLPRAKGAEKLLMEMICANLRHIPNSSTADFYRGYAAKRAISAVRTFREYGFYTEALSLLSFLVNGNWFEDQDINDFKTTFMTEANQLLYHDESLSNELTSLANKLNLCVYNVDGKTAIGTENDNPVTRMRQRIEKAVLDTTTIDLSGVGDKMQKLERSSYALYNNIKDTFDKKKQNVSENVAENKPKVVSRKLQPEPIPEPLIAEHTDEVMQIVDDVVKPAGDLLDRMEQSANINTISNTHTSENIAATSVEEVANSVSLPETDSIEDFLRATNHIVDTDDTASEVPIQHVEEVKKASVEAPEITDIQEKEKQDVKNSVSRILNVTSKELDAHFAKIKNVTSSALSIAEGQAGAVRKKMENMQIPNAAKDKLQSLVEKIPFSKKK